MLVNELVFQRAEHILLAQLFRRTRVIVRKRHIDRFTFCDNKLSTGSRTERFIAPADGLVGKEYLKLESLACIFSVRRDIAAFLLWWLRG